MSYQVGVSVPGLQGLSFGSSLPLDQVHHLCCENECVEGCRVEGEGVLQASEMASGQSLQMKRRFSSVLEPRHALCSFFVGPARPYPNTLMRKDGEGHWSKNVFNAPSQLIVSQTEAHLHR